MRRGRNRGDFGDETLVTVRSDEGRSVGGGCERSGLGLVVCLGWE